MTQLQEINKGAFLSELHNRVIANEISEEEVFQALTGEEEITEYEATAINFKSLTKEDWKKACQILENDENYQEEVKLWEAIGDE